MDWEDGVPMRGGDGIGGGGMGIWNGDETDFDLVLVLGVAGVKMGP